MVSDISSSRIVPAATVADAAAGDAMAFARIVQAHHDDMTRVCSVICGDPEMAQDAAHVSARASLKSSALAPDDQIAKG